jgi:MFS family permease
MYYGWYVVAVCFVAASFTWGFGVYGASVYLSQITVSLGWPVALISGGVTTFYLANAASLTAVGSAVDRWGARPVFLLGSLMLAAGIAAMGQVAEIWQLYVAFALIGLGYACLSLTGLTAAIGPWFERHQGRSIAIALMGASIGGMVVVPLLVVSIDRFGFTPAMSGSSLLTAAVLLPLVAVVLRYRGPSELGLVPDGGALPHVSYPAAAPTRWTRREAMATAAFWTATLAFALGLAAQVGFFTHQVNLARPVLGTEGAGWLAGATGFANLLGRLLLARIVDQMPVRRYTAAIFGAQAVALIVLALAGGPAVLIVTSLIYGFCLGQITTLSPIVVRREFGAASFGAIYGVAATVIQLTSALGPGIYGVLHDALGGYTPVMAIAAGVEIIAMAAMLVGRAPKQAPDKEFAFVRSSLEAKD